MAAHARGQRTREQGSLLRRLLPPGEPTTASELVQELGLWDRPAQRSPRRPTERPRVLLNMISSADGRATVSGRSGPLSGTADRELFHALRTAVDGVLVGAGTVRMERYGRLIRDPARRRLRRERGLSEEPLACVVSGRLELDSRTPLLADPQARVVIVTPSEASLQGTRAQIEYLRAHRHGLLDLTAALAELRSSFGIELLLCEGGPHLFCELLAADLVDELFLTIAPLLAGGEPMLGESLRILAGLEFEPPRHLQLRGVLESDSELLLRYEVGA